MGLEEQVQAHAQELGQLRGQMKELRKRIDSVELRLLLYAMGGAAAGGLIGSAGGAAARTLIGG